MRDGVWACGGLPKTLAGYLWVRPLQLALNIVVYDDDLPGGCDRYVPDPRLLPLPRPEAIW